MIATSQPDSVDGPQFWVPTDTCQVALVAERSAADNYRVISNPAAGTRRSLRTDLAVAVIVGLGVIASGTADWLRGQPPASRLPSFMSGYAVFVGATLVCISLAALVAVGRLDPIWKYGALAAAAVAVAVADPTYASMLFAAPLIEIGRRSPDPERLAATGATIALIIFLVSTESTNFTSSEMEGVFVLAIALAIVVMFGHALRRNDEVRVAEARLARVDERNRLAEELHDSLGHNLLATSIQLRNASALLDRDPVRAARSVDLAGQAVAEALADTRFAVDSIRADGDGFSLERSLPDLVERVTPPSMNIAVSVNGDHSRLDQLTQITLYRFAQEALSNIVRHAEAATASLDSSVAADGVTMTISDDGRGFQDPSSTAGAGLENLRERLARIGGRLDVVSDRGQGATLTASISGRVSADLGPSRRLGA